MTPDKATVKHRHPDARATRRVSAMDGVARYRIVRSVQGGRSVVELSDWRLDENEAWAQAARKLEGAA